MQRLAILGLVLVAGCAAPPSGILLMAHGGDEAWNKDVEAAVEPLRRKYALEIAFGMADPETLEQAVARLEARGIRRIAVVRMFVSSDSFIEATEYILGLRDDPPVVEHGAHAAAPSGSASLAADGQANGAEPHPPADGGSCHPMSAPRRIPLRAEIRLSRKGVAESALIDGILVDRAKALSAHASRERILLLAHGPADDRENERWLALMDQRAAALRTLGFREVRCETLREDWPEKRATAEQRIREFVERGNRDGGRVIVIPFRVAGFGPYHDVLRGLSFVSDGRGHAQAGPGRRSCGTGLNSSAPSPLPRLRLS